MDCLDDPFVQPLFNDTVEQALSLWTTHRCGRLIAVEWQLTWQHLRLPPGREISGDVSFNLRWLFIGIKKNVRLNKLTIFPFLFLVFLLWNFISNWLRNHAVIGRRIYRFFARARKLGEVGWLDHRTILYRKEARIITKRARALCFDCSFVRRGLRDSWFELFREIVVLAHFWM